MRSRRSWCAWRLRVFAGGCGRSSLSGSGMEQAQCRSAAARAAAATALAAACLRANCTARVRSSLSAPQSAQRLKEERDELQGRLDQSALEQTMGAALAETQARRAAWGGPDAAAAPDASYLCQLPEARHAANVRPRHLHTHTTLTRVLPFIPPTAEAQRRG